MSPIPRLNGEDSDEIRQSGKRQQSRLKWQNSSHPQTGRYTPHIFTRAYHEGTDEVFVLEVPRHRPVGEPILARDPEGNAVSYGLDTNSSAHISIDASTGQLFAHSEANKIGAPGVDLHAYVLAWVPGEESRTRGYVLVKYGYPNRPPASVQYNSPLRRSVREDAAVGASIGDPIVTTDPDSDAITYSLHEKVVQRHAGRFRITPAGQLEVAQPLSFMDIAGFEGTDVPKYHIGSDTLYMNGLSLNAVQLWVPVTATDARGASGSVDVVVTVHYVDRSPVFTSDTVRRSVPENSALGTVAGDPVSASDPNGETLNYALSSGDGRLALEVNTGQLTVTSPLDYEITKELSVNVTATDPRGWEQSPD